MYFYILCLFFFIHVVIGNPLKNISNKPALVNDTELFKDPYQVQLATSEECKSDVRSLCGPNLSKSNFETIYCLQEGSHDTKLSDSCQHLLWTYKMNVTTDSKYEKLVKDMCNSMIVQIPECLDLLSSKGHLIPCLINFLPITSSNRSLSSHNCISFLTRLKPVVFSDFRIIYKFSDACQSDIDSFQCGRIDQSFNQMHNQGKVLTCLATHILKLHPQCKFELLRVAEMQADDYHNDRQLYYACRNDREKFCSDLKSGQSRVYKCLYQHKGDPEMSRQCDQMLRIRQQLEQEDYKINMGLAHKCQYDVVNNHCLKGLHGVASFTHAKMSAILLCLEGVLREGTLLNSDCVHEMKLVRRSMMQDFNINPLAVAHCSNEISNYCGGDINKDGSTIHCLMSLSKPSNKNNFEVKISDLCLRTLEELLVEVDVASNIEVDPVLHQTCLSVANTYCSEVRSGEGRILECLLDSLDKPRMTEECKERLMEFQYFLTKDFRLDPHLYKACHKDAQEFCQAPQKWYDPESTEPNMDFLVFSCLFKHSYFQSKDTELKKISSVCSGQVKRVIRERALANNLDPQVQHDCLPDLSAFCLNEADKEGEMSCLEENFESLKPDCKKVISDYISNVDRDPSISGIFLKNCFPVFEEFCQSDYESQKLDENMGEKQEMQLMECLIRNKKSKLMNHKCRTGVEHHQLMTLKNYHFSPKFNEACGQDINTFCRGSDSKDFVLTCLSEMLLNDTLLEHPIRISASCQNQLNFQLLQRSEDINLDPELRGSCLADIDQFCPQVQHGESAIVECLTRHFDQLSPRCHKVLFKRKEIEAINPGSDYTLYTKCKNMMKKFCMEHVETPESLFGCLQQNKDDQNFDSKCREVVIDRSHLFSADIRLNRDLSKACKGDTEKFCEKELEDLWSGAAEDEGKVVQCLKNTYIHQRDKGKELSSSCRSHIKSLIHLSALDFRLDYPLVKHCHREIFTICKDETQKVNNILMEDGKEAHYNDEGKVENCLKEAVAKKLISNSTNPHCFREVSRLLEEGLVEFMADTKLNRACSIDARMLCPDVPSEKKLECLLLIHSKEVSNLSPGCSELLVQRLKLWKIALPKQDIPQNLQEVVNLVTSSPSSQYLLGVLALIVFFIFCFGLCFGRITKRRRAYKDR